MKKTGFIALLFVLGLLCGCALPKENSISFFSMDTVMRISAYEADDAMLRQAKTLIESMHAELSATEENSALSLLNRSGSAAFSPESAELLQAALALCATTDGALDISIYPVVCAWGFPTGQYRVPSQKELAELLKKVDYRAVQLAEDHRVYVADGMMIDLGSVAKGCAGDRVCALLREYGITSALLDLGGNVQLIGSKPNGSAWKIAIQAPEGDGYLGVLDAADEAVVTSGGYERFFVDENGITRRHILDPKTGMPVENGLLSVTVVGKSGFTCDGLSTALFVMGEEQAEAFWRENGGFEMLLLDESGTLHITPALAQRFQAEAYPVEVIAK